MGFLTLPRVIGAISLAAIFASLDQLRRPCTTTRSTPTPKPVDRVARLARPDAALKGLTGPTDGPARPGGAIWQHIDSEMGEPVSHDAAQRAQAVHHKLEALKLIPEADRKMLLDFFAKVRDQNRTPNDRGPYHDLLTAVDNGYRSGYSGPTSPAEVRGWRETFQELIDSMKRARLLSAEPDAGTGESPEATP